MFSWEYCEILNNTYFKEHVWLWTATSELYAFLILFWFEKKIFETWKHL